MLKPPRVLGYLLIAAPLAAAHAASLPSDVDAPKLTFQPIRSADGIRAKQAGDSLKPKLETAEFLPVTSSLAVHIDSDGKVHYTCDADHPHATPSAELQPDAVLNTEGH